MAVYDSHVQFHDISALRMVQVNKHTYIYIYIHINIYHITRCLLFRSKPPASQSLPGAAARLVLGRCCAAPAFAAAGRGVLGAACAGAAEVGAAAGPALEMSVAGRDGAVATGGKMGLETVP